jgi:hypothetical protein
MTLSPRASAPVFRALRSALLLAAVLGPSACAGTARNPFAAPGTRETQIQIQVENQGFNDLRLYANSSQGTRSLGSVQGNSVRRMNLDWRQAGQLSFRMEVLAGRSYTTHAVSASPGDLVFLVIPRDPSGAYVRVR